MIRLAISLRVLSQRGKLKVSRRACSSPQHACCLAVCVLPAAMSRDVRMRVKDELPVSM